MTTNCPKCGRWAPYGVCPDHGDQVTSEASSGPPGDGLKECSKCHLRKPLERFSRNNASLDSYQGQCKLCRAAYDRAWANRPVVREANLARMRRVNNGRRRKEKANA
jgi:hypothetical protein